MMTHSRSIYDILKDDTISDCKKSSEIEDKIYHGASVGCKLTYADGFTTTYLLVACQTCSPIVISALLKHCPELLYKKNSNGCNAVHIAAESANLGVLTYLFETARQLFFDLSYEGYTTSFFALRSNNLEILKLTTECSRKLSYQANRLHIDESQNKSLISNTLAKYITQGLALPIIKYLIEEYKISLTELLFKGGAVIHLVANYNRIDVMAYLIQDQKVDINFPDIKGLTPLFFATDQKHPAMIRWLVDNKANITSDALTSAVSDLTTLKFLMQSKANPHVPNQKGFYIQHCAAAGGNNEALMFLIGECKLDPNQLTYPGPNAREVPERPLYCAILRNQVHTVKLLIENFKVKANEPCITAELNLHPLQCAVSNNGKEISRYLINEHKIDVNYRYLLGRTLFSSTGDLKSPSMVLWLLEQGARADLTDDEEHTPLHFYTSIQNVYSIIALYSTAIFFIPDFHKVFSGLPKRSASHLIRCMLAHEENNPLAVLNTLKNKCRSVNIALEDLYDDSEANILAVAKLWNTFITLKNQENILNSRATSFRCIHIIAIELACTTLHYFSLVGKKGLNPFPPKSLANDNKDHIYSFHCEDYLRVPLKRIKSAMFPDNPSLFKRPSSRKLFWEELIRQEQGIVLKQHSHRNQVGESLPKRQKV